MLYTTDRYIDLFISSHPASFEDTEFAKLQPMDYKSNHYNIGMLIPQISLRFDSNLLKCEFVVINLKVNSAFLVGCLNCANVT